MIWCFLYLLKVFSWVLFQKEKIKRSVTELLIIRKTWSPLIPEQPIFLLGQVPLSRSHLTSANGILNHVSRNHACSWDQSDRYWAFTILIDLNNNKFWVSNTAIYLFSRLHIVVCCGRKSGLWKRKSKSLIKRSELDI